MIVDGAKALDTAVTQTFGRAALVQRCQLRQIRADLALTQTQLAQRIGAAGKAVICQWESRKRQPSPVFWTRIDQLRADADGPRTIPPAARRPPGWHPAFTVAERRGYSGVGCSAAGTPTSSQKCKSQRSIKSVHTAPRRSARSQGA